MTDLFRLLPEEVDDLVTGLGAPRYRADQLLQALYRSPVARLEDIRGLPATLIAALRDGGWTIGSATERAQTRSEDGETIKVLLEMAGGTLIETVLMQYRRPDRHPRSTVCVSTQAGCAMGCVFCATGQMGFARNLAAEEMVAEVVHLARLLRTRGEHITNIVFMGMGEPLANYAETIRAVRIMSHPRALGISQRAITISTVGVISGIDRLAEEDLHVNLAISLHAPNDALRQQLVPTAAPSSVKDLVAAAKRFRKRTGRRVSFEYALIDHVNDDPSLASELAARLKGTDAHVNIIPINPTAGGFRRPSRQRLLAFQAALRAGGVNCTVRVEKGTEIAAACGQLRTEIEGTVRGSGPRTDNTRQVAVP